MKYQYLYTRCRKTQLLFKITNIKGSNGTCTINYQNYKNSGWKKIELEGKFGLSFSFDEKGKILDDPDNPTPNVHCKLLTEQEMSEKFFSDLL